MDVDNIDIPGTCLQTDIDEHVIVLLKGILTEFMDLVDPRLYSKYVTTEKIYKRCFK